MKISIMFSWALLALTANALAQGISTQDGASATSNTDVSASRAGASATNSSAASANTQHAQADAVGSSEMSATLSKPVDARKAKPGDTVTATNDRDVKTADGTSIKRGSTLVGHVTQAKPLGGSTSGSAGASGDSMLSIVFDKAILKDGREVPLNATIQALSAAESGASLASDTGSAGMYAVGSGAGSARAGGGGLIGGSVGGGLGAAGAMSHGVGAGVNGAVGGMSSSTVHSAGAVGGLSSSGMLTAGSKGVFGIQSLDIVASSEGSAIISSTRNVRLDSGAKLLLSNRGDHSVTVSGATRATGSVSHANAAQDSSGSAAGHTTREAHDHN